MKFVVLGGYGIIGRVVVSDLVRFAKNAQIVIAGRDIVKAKKFADSLNSNRVSVQHFDVGNHKSMAKVLKGSDVTVNCIQYYFNLEIMKAAIHAKTHYVDLGGMFHITKKQLELDKEFKRIGKTAILGIGGAPGISNVLAYYGCSSLKKVNDVDISFADKDESTYSQNFVLPYSFKTLVDEFSEKPAVFENGKIKFVEPYTGTKEYHFDEWGKRKGFLTLHSEIATLPTSLKDKGIKKCEFRVTFPGEFNETMETLIKLGFTSKNKIKIKDKEVSIIDVSGAIMDRMIPKAGTKLKDCEIIRVGINSGSVIMEALTESDGKTSAGTLDTGVPCSIAAQLLARNRIEKKGVLAPELALNADEFFEELAERDIQIMKDRRQIN